MKIKIISGGQTGVDQAALDFALDHGFKCGGYCPRGRKNEQGSIANRYPLSEIDSEDYLERTRRNIVESDGTLIFKDFVEVKGGTIDTINLCEQFLKPYLIVNLEQNIQRNVIFNWLQEFKIVILNIAGNRESASPGICEKSYLYLIKLFNL